MADPAQDRVHVADLARGLGVSYSWFRRTFAHHTGLSPHQYRLQLKVGRARTLLRETALTVKEVAFRCGFESEQYFCRLFRRKTGLAPGEWRRSKLSPRASRRAAHGERLTRGRRGRASPAAMRGTGGRSGRPDR
jgi:transcriptional regulator GlxA family with amidase domain